MANSEIRLDLHGLTVPEARKKLQNAIASASPQIKQIRVIHGCNSGTAIRDMVRKQSSPRISGRTNGFANDGETILYLK